MFIFCIFQILLTQLDMTTSMLQIVEMKIVKVKISSYYRFYLKCLFVCLKLPEQFFGYWVAVTISSDRQGCIRSSLSIYANMGFSSHGSLSAKLAVTQEFSLVRMIRSAYTALTAAPHG